MISLDVDMFCQNIGGWLKDDPVQELAELSHESVVCICIYRFYLLISSTTSKVCSYLLNIFCMFFSGYK